MNAKLVDDILNEYENRVIYFNCKKIEDRAAIEERKTEISFMFQVLSSMAYNNSTNEQQTTRIRKIWRYLREEQQRMKIVVARAANEKLHEDLGLTK